VFGITTIGTSELIGEILFPTSISYVYEKPSEIQFSQNHLFKTTDITYTIELTHSTISQLHVLTAPDNIQVTSVPDIGIQQAHLLTTFDTKYQYQSSIPNFSQDHKISTVPISYQYTGAAEVQFNQNHIFAGTDIIYQNIGRTPFVNPSVVRIVLATDDSSNELVFETQSNSVEVLPSINKYK
jgi:hypothetical protein